MNHAVFISRHRHHPLEAVRCGKQRLLRGFYRLVRRIVDAFKLISGYISWLIPVSRFQEDRSRRACSALLFLE